MPAFDPPDLAAVTQLYADYANAVDTADWDAWCALFTDDCRYRLMPRENHERGMPLATMDFESKGMLMDRAYAVRETLFHDPYYQRHIVGVARLLRVEHDGWRTEANYAVIRTKLSQPSLVFNVGRYLDHIVRTPDGLRFKTRLVVYDSELIPNSIIYPI